MKRLIIGNPNLERSEKTFLDADYTSGTSLTVINNFGFANDDFVIVGAPGEEKTETKDVTGFTGDTTISISASLQFSHNKGTTIYRFEYDQLEIYRYRGGAWTLISTSDIQWDKRETIYIDTSGVATDEYKYRYKNSASVTYSDYSPNIPASGFERNQVGYMVSEVRKLIGDEDKKLFSDTEIIHQFNRAQDIIKARRTSWWFLRKESKGEITTVLAYRRYGLNTYLSDMNYIDTVRYRYNDGTTDNIYHLKKISMVEMDYLVRDNNASRDDWPEYYTIEPKDSLDDTGYISIDKTTETTGRGSFYIRYFKKMTDLSTIISETDVPIPSILEDYALSYCFRFKGDEARAAIYEKRFFGPASKRESYDEPTGMALLEIMQNNKGKAIGQPESIKKWRGRGAMTNFFNNSNVDLDSLRERYF